ncbi:MAG TPA: hypothetical protein VHB20_03490 [Verrucomicrobiae bacterium]|nr:hypothetical protein [Verrucomicrobiae bacterium]
MSEAALARAQAEIVARMMAQTDILAYDYMASSNFINPNGFDTTTNGENVNNVNYDLRKTGNAVDTWKVSNPGNIAQNIANLYFDPRPPVFVQTNTDPTKPPAYDFRYYVDLNRNGKFEGSSFRTSIAKDNTALPVVGMNSVPGEPEWIGVLADPTLPHSATNYFIGRYAYMVLPIGKTLDLNFIHNESQNVFNASSGQDHFVRNQGVGSWEINLAAYLRELNTNSYDNPLTLQASQRYAYHPTEIGSATATGDFGLAFQDAYSFLTNRNLGQLSLSAYYGGVGNPVYQGFLNDGIDAYGASVNTNLNGPFDLTAATDPEGARSDGVSNPWPGSYLTNMFYDMQDVFDPNKTGPSFANRLATNGGLVGWPNSVSPDVATYDRYTYQRMLTSIGTGSEPEYSVYVYPDTTNIYTSTNFGTIPTLLRTKMNLNYDNAAQMAAGPYAPMPTNLVSWTNDPLKFFTNAADLLLRTQDFPIVTNLITTTNSLTPYAYVHFGYSNLNSFPIYSKNVPSLGYTAQFHRMLQLAANLYDESQNQNGQVNGTNYVLYPTVFRPVFNQSNDGSLFITGYKLVKPADVLAGGQLSPAKWKFPTNNVLPDDNVYGIPWVIGAVKGLPAFQQFCDDTAFAMTRKVEVVRNTKDLGGIPIETNQLYEFSISNQFGFQAWNSYRTPFNPPVDVTAKLQSSIIFTNNSGSFPWGTNFYIYAPTVGFSNFAKLNPPWAGWGHGSSDASMWAPIQQLTNLLCSLDHEPLVWSDVAATRGMWDIANQNTPHWDEKSFTVHGWVLTVTNYVTYILQDHLTGAILDFVNVGPFGTSLDITNILNHVRLPGDDSQLSMNIVWNPLGADDSPSSGVSQGELQQLSIGANFVGVPDYSPSPVDSQNFANLLLKQAVKTNAMQCPFTPSAVFVAHATLSANDPLVHYTMGDLLSPSGITNNIVKFKPTTMSDLPLTNTLNQESSRYEPWPDQDDSGVGRNLGLKDPKITSSDDWHFPTNRFPSVGWIGRVHRGTPWQTIFLKADPLPGTDPKSNPWLWINKWVGDLSAGLPLPGASYPTNDWGLLDLFTTAPHENALRGTLSVNQTGSAAWHALFDGVVGFITNPQGVVGSVIDPTAPPPAPYNNYPNVTSVLLDAVNLVDGSGAPLPDGIPVVAPNGATNLEYGINAYRLVQTNGLYHHIGDILRAPTLTIASPLIGLSTAQPDDMAYERIPQQIGSLLKVGEPQFVIYSWGQSLRPLSLYNSGGAGLFKVCTNYSITGEFLTRTVCHLDLTRSDRFGQTPRLKVDSFNIIPAAQ